MECIRFYVFHLRSGITKLLLNYLRRFLRRQSVEIRSQFNTELEKFWRPYLVMVWKFNKSLNKLKGNEIKRFINNVDNTVSWLKNKFPNLSHMNYFCEALSLWKTISQFLFISKIDDNTNYEEELARIEIMIEKFYNIGRLTFLTDKDEGDHETFYVHCLRFYIVPHAKITFDRHGVGIGIFTMQGFEHRNKESKHIYNCHNNNSGNMCHPTMTRLYDKFYYNC